jgi:hypothetical protein
MNIFPVWRGRRFFGTIDGVTMWSNVAEDFDGEAGREDEGLSDAIEERSRDALCDAEPPFACLEAVGRRKLMMDNNWKLNEKVSF